MEITITDPDVISWLSQFADDEQHDRVISAIRVGVLAIRQAIGSIDRQAVHDEGQLLIQKIENQVMNTLSQMIGSDSEFRRMLDPKHSDGVLQQLQAVVNKELDGYGTEVLAAFSLDDPQSPLSRLVTHIRDSQANIAKNFSLDDPNSGISRLLQQLKKILDTYEQANAEFREQVQQSIQELNIRKESEALSTTHGLRFEDSVVDFIKVRGMKAGDVVTATGNTTGIIKNCKVGDCVLELGPDNAAKGEKIVFEAKEDSSYTIASALNEIEKGRRNRIAQIGVFVFSSKSVSDTTKRLQRFGRDIIVVWDSEDQSADVWLEAAIELARGLIIEDVRSSSKTPDVDFAAIERAIEAVAKRAERTDQVRTWGQTIESTGGKIVKEMENSRKDLDKQVAILRDHIQDVLIALDEIRTDDKP